MDASWASHASYYISCCVISSRTFSLAPAALSLFSFGREWETYRGDVPKDLFEGAAFRVHAKAVIGMLGYVVATMANEDVSHLLAVGDALQQLGARHISYGVHPGHYLVVQTALLRVLESALGDTWTPDVRQGWAAVYKFVAKAMQAGEGSEVEIVRVRRRGGGARKESAVTLRLRVFTKSQETSWHSISRFQDSAREQQRSLKNQAPRIPCRTSEWDVVVQSSSSLSTQQDQDDDDDDENTGSKILCA